MTKIEQDDLKAMRHSCEHVLTQAMLRLYHQIKMAMGPAIEDGFYFDFDPGKIKISENDFPKIEKEMQKIITANLPIKQGFLSPKEARKLFKNNLYKQEWIDEIENRGEKVSIYWTGDEFVDLCSGPHITSTGKIGPFKLLSVAGAYWHGDEKNKMLTRIYGTCFPTQKELDEFIKLQEEAKKRDHRKLGKEMELFLINDDVGPGLPIILPKGNIIIKELQNYVRQLQKKLGYQEIISPHIGRKKLWEVSGHWQHYQELMYPPITVENDNYLIKTMNCPFHIMVYKNKMHSYKDLPIKISEFATVYRYEKSGELSGLLRVREITQDDGHIFCTEEQLQEQIWEVIELTETHFKTLEMADYVNRLSLRDPNSSKNYMGSEKLWKIAEKSLKEALEERKTNYILGTGEAAFYGPKIDPIVKDTLGREWQFGTIQVDFMLPERFDLKYIDKNGKEKRPIMIHRAPLGAFERTLGILTEHYGGAFPVWLAPTQVKIIPIADRHQSLGKEILEKLFSLNIRAEIDNRTETMQAKIRDAQMQKIPYMIIIGDREVKNQKVAVRERTGKDLGQMDLTYFINRIKEDIEEKRNL